jgi:predicted DNA-binding transcriptional regulator AlpA
MGVKMNNNPKVFLNTQELCDSIGISRSTLMRKVRAHIYPFNQNIKLGKRRLYSIGIIDALAKMANNQKFTIGGVK